MAEKPASKRRQLRKVETVRERTEKTAKKAPKTRRLHKASSHIGRPLKAAVHLGRKEYYLPMPDNKLGRFLNKRRSAMPRYFIKSFAELRQVNWPNRRTTLHLSMAVFIFAVFFGLLVALTDYGLDKLFKALIIK